MFGLRAAVTDSAADATVIAAFAVGWTPCVARPSPAASASQTVGHGGVLLALYSL